MTTPDPDIQPFWPNGHDRVPYRIYTDRAVYERELARIFSGPTWNYVGLECEISEPGSYKRTVIGEQSILITRAQDGSIHGMLNRCAHRGVQVCQADLGKAAEFMCPYHQWIYDLKGQLIGVPFRRGVKGKGGMPKDFKPEDHRMPPVRVHARGGAIFATRHDDTPDFESYLGQPLLGFYDRVFDGRKLRLLGHSRQRIPSNWKLIIENIKDPYHASLLHVFFVTFGLFRVDNESRVQMDATGLHTALSSKRGKQEINDGTSQMKSFQSDLALNDPRLLDTVREFPGDTTVVMHTIWPNLILQQQSNTLATRQIVPRGPGEFDLNWTFFGYEDDDEEMTARRLRQANLMGPAGLVSIDDSEIVARNQDGFRATPDALGIVEMGGRDCDDTDHMVTEAALRAFYRGYRKVMEL